MPIYTLVLSGPDEGSESQSVEHNSGFRRLEVGDEVFEGERWWKLEEQLGEREPPTFRCSPALPVIIHGEGIDAPLFRGELDELEPQVQANAPDRPGRDELLEAFKRIRFNERIPLSADALRVLAAAIEAIQVEGAQLSENVDRLRVELREYFEQPDSES